MADFQLALQNTLKFEDSKSHPGIVTPEPHNGRARLGINSNAHPDLPDTFWTCDYADALEQAGKIYQNDYWAPLKLDQVNDQAIANKIFDIAVDSGVRTAARYAQQVAKVIAIDGTIGPLTLAAINAADPASFLAGLRQLATLHYENLLTENPEEYGPWREGWLTRAAS